MKTKYFLLMTLLLVSFATEAKTDKRTVTFNVMMNGKEAEKEIKKKLAEEVGVLSLKVDRKQYTVEVSYDASQTNIASIAEVFKKNGFSATPIGENCSVKKGGCLNNAPTQFNTMK